MFAMIFTMICEIYTVSLFSQCAKCDQQRAYNAAHPENNYTYYDDYLQDQHGKKAAPETTAPKAPESPAPSSKPE